MYKLSLAVILSLTVFAGAAVAGPTGPALTVGSIVTGTCSDDAPAIFQFNADKPGLLAVAIRGTGDLMLFVTDQDGQAILKEDTDFGGNRGAEQLMAPLPAAGTYFVFVVSRGDRHTFELGASWLGFPKVGRAADPDGRPGTAQELTIGKKAADSIHPSGDDQWDWRKVTDAETGALTVLTKVEGDGDLALEVFADGKFLAHLDRSDKDLRGNKGNESVTVEATAGQTYYFRVTSPISSSDRIEYSISSGFIPQ